MTTPLICPRCNKRFEDEEFCPQHGIALLPVPEPEAEGELAAPAEALSTAGQPPAPLEEAPAAEAASTEAAMPAGPEAAAGASPAPQPAQPPKNGAAQPSAQPTAAAASAAGPGAPPAPRPRAAGIAGALELLGRKMGLPGFKPRAAAAAAEKGPAPTAHAAAPAPAPAPAESSPLPPEVLAMGWCLAGVPMRVAGADQWPVQMDTSASPRQGVLCLPASGSLTTAAVYERLQAAPATQRHRARLWQHGTLNRGHGLRSDYELVSLPAAGQELGRWLQSTQPSEARALSLLAPLHALLQALVEEGVVPLVLEPALLQRLDDGALCLSRIWALTEAPAAQAPAVQRYRPEFQRTTLLPVPWAAPELSASQVESVNALAFSVGQLLACALWGAPATHQDLRAGALPFQAIAHEGLARLMQCCLWIGPEGRITLGPLLAALADPDPVRMPEAPAWASLMPGAAAQAFRLAGANFWRLEDLLARATRPEHWDEATHQIEALLAWAQGTAWAGTAGVVQHKLRHGGRSPDWALVQLNRQVRPSSPLTWRRLDLSDAQADSSLAALAQGALAGSPDDLQLMQQLMEADLRGALLTDALHTGPH